MDYIKALEEERKKVMVFERELPLSLQLVTQAIETYRKQQQQQQQQQERSEEISSEGPILEEFIPLRPSCSSSNEENINRTGNSNGFDKIPDWLRSVQLWNQQPDPKGDAVRKPIAVNTKRMGGAFHPFEREKVAAKPASVAEAPSSSTTENTNGGGGGSSEEKVDKEKEGHSSQRKARRCWSPELHRRFLHALQQIGGSHAATPKHIRELMKVDGLTNDEVKSHLQKYRLHTRRPTAPAVQSGGDSSPQQPQIVLVGGVWVPPPEYTAAAAPAAAAAAQPSADKTGAPLNGVYAPVASVPSEFCKQLKTGRSPTGRLKSERRNDGDSNSSDAERTNSDSLDASSSSQTTTALPPL